MLVDFEVAFRLDGQIEKAMHRHELEHVVEEREPRLHRRLAGPVEREADLDVGLLRPPGAPRAS